jgi:hypothetical protein
MRILFAASENAWGGFLGLIRSELPEYHFEASGNFEVKSLEGFDEPISKRLKSVTPAKADVQKRTENTG